ncbi:MAG: exosortase C-terminal domain/associated protein EpsI [Bryobacteraceae bacterium]
MRPRSPAGVIFLLSAAVLVLVLQIWFQRDLRHDPIISQTRSLDEFPSIAGRWRSTGPVPPSPALLRRLSADEILSRNYTDGKTGLTISLLVAYYRTQLHLNRQYDLEEYLPDEGWSQLYSAIVQLPQKSNYPIPIRYDLVIRGQERLLILRWFQTKEKVLADGQDLHFYRVLNAVANHRTDLAAVQIVTPVLIDPPKQEAENALDFAQQVVNLTAATLFSP